MAYYVVCHVSCHQYACLPWLPEIFQEHHVLQIKFQCTDPRYHSTDPRYHCTDPRYHSTDPRYPCTDTRYHCTDPRYHSTDPRYHSTDPRYHSTDPRYHSTDPRYHSTDQRYHSTDPRYHCTDPRYHCTDPRYHSTDPRYHCTDPRYHSTDPRYHSTDPRYHCTDQIISLTALTVGVITIIRDRKAFAKPWGSFQWWRPQWTRSQSSWGCCCAPSFPARGPRPLEPRCWRRWRSWWTGQSSAGWPRSDRSDECWNRQGWWSLRHLDPHPCIPVWWCELTELFLYLTSRFKLKPAPYKWDWPSVSVQLSSRWYLCARESPYALHPISQKFPFILSQFLIPRLISPFLHNLSHRFLFPNPHVILRVLFFPPWVSNGNPPPPSTPIVCLFSEIAFILPGH